MDAAGQLRLEQLRREGWCVIPAVIPAESMAAVRGSVLATSRAHADASPELLEAQGVLHLPSLINYDQSLAPYMASRALLDVIEEHLGPAVKISFTTSQTNLAGCPRGECTPIPQATGSA